MRSFDEFPRLVATRPGQLEADTAALPSSFSRMLVASARLAGAAVFLLPAEASAHVKWFAPTNVGEDLIPPIEIGTPLFWAATAFACLALFMAALVEQTPVARRLSAHVEAATDTRFAPVEQILRTAVGGFFLSLWARGGVLLTPELLTDADWITWLQLGISACMLDRRLLPLGGLGVLALYCQGVRQHGLFHMIDYVFFLGLACYLVLSAWTWAPLLGARMPVLRISLAFSLMWVSIEKFVYPHWTLCVMQQHPIITFGFEPHAVTQLAGIVEFSLAFSLLWTPLIRRAAAVVLAVLMSAAILEFGKIDALGHIIPIALLIAIALEQSRFPALRHTLAPFLLCGSLGVMFTSYYVAHAML